MQSPSNTLSERIRVQAAELLNLADAIDQYSKAQRVHWTGQIGADFTAVHGLFDVTPAKEDYSDLTPNPPDDPTAWRGAMLRRFRNDTGPA